MPWIFALIAAVAVHYVLARIRSTRRWPRWVRAGIALAIGLVVLGWTLSIAPA